jgi:replicative DNA helicase
MRLKALAKELEVPIVLCAQMNRQIEQDANRRPRLSDLKDTGQLEQDSDVVMFLWKPPIDMTNEKQAARVYSILGRVPVPDLWKGLERNSEGKNWKGYMSLVNCTVEKQREGRSGEDALLVFIKPWTRFVDAYNA